MEGYANTLTYLASVFTVLLLLVLMITVITRLSTGKWFPTSVEPHVRTWSLYLIALFSTVAVVMSLWYSEVLGFTPCSLCWFARTMMFPIAVIAIVAAWRADRSVWPYTITLSLIGMFITGYQHLYQIGAISGAFCNALEGGGDCAKRYVFEFDFVTMPLMGFTLFAIIALLAWLSRRP